MEHSEPPKEPMTAVDRALLIFLLTCSAGISGALILLAIEVLK
mgnify:CR=1 FL=1